SRRSYSPLPQNEQIGVAACHPTQPMSCGGDMAAQPFVLPTYPTNQGTLQVSDTQTLCCCPVYRAFLAGVAQGLDSRPPGREVTPAVAERALPLGPAIEPPLGRRTPPPHLPEPLARVAWRAVTGPPRQHQVRVGCPGRLDRLAPHVILAKAKKAVAAR